MNELALTPTAHRIALIVSRAGVRARRIRVDPTGDLPTSISETSESYFRRTPADAAIAVYVTLEQDLPESLLVGADDLVDAITKINPDHVGEMTELREQLRHTITNAEDLIAAETRRSGHIISEARDWKTRYEAARDVAAESHEIAEARERTSTGLRRRLRAATEAASAANLEAAESRGLVDDLRHRLDVAQTNALHVIGEIIDRLGTADDTPVDAEILEPNLEIRKCFGPDDMPTLEVTTPEGDFASAELRVYVDGKLVFHPTGRATREAQPGTVIRHHYAGDDGATHVDYLVGVDGTVKPISERAHQNDLLSAANATIARQLDIIRDQAESVEELTARVVELTDERTELRGELSSTASALRISEAHLAAANRETESFKHDHAKAISMREVLRDKLLAERSEAEHTGFTRIRELEAEVAKLVPIANSGSALAGYILQILPVMETRTLHSIEVGQLRTGAIMTADRAHGVEGVETKPDALAAAASLLHSGATAEQIHAATRTIVSGRLKNVDLDILCPREQPTT